MSVGTVIICSRCATVVTFKDVTPGYFAVCPEHDEDLFTFETVEVIDQ